MKTILGNVHHLGIYVVLALSSTISACTTPEGVAKRDPYAIIWWSSADVRPIIECTPDRYIQLTPPRWGDMPSHAVRTFSQNPVQQEYWSAIAETRVYGDEPVPSRSAAPTFLVSFYTDRAEVREGGTGLFQPKAIFRALQDCVQAMNGTIVRTYWK